MERSLTRVEREWLDYFHDLGFEELYLREVLPATLEALAAVAAECTACKLAAGRKHVVFGSGDPKADLLLIGEGPGAAEDRQGLPFVGPAGELLTKILRAIDLERADVYIANVVKCRPPGNRDPQPDEVAACRGYLNRQIDLVRPRAIVALGTGGRPDPARSRCAAGTHARDLARRSRRADPGHVPPGRALAEPELQAADLGGHAGRPRSPARGRLGRPDGSVARMTRMERQIEPAPAAMPVAGQPAPELSVLVPVLDEEGTVEELARQVAAILDEVGRSFEIVFVDDGSTDGTVERIRRARQADPRVKLVGLRRNFGKAAALCAGFEASSGQILITMDGDLQDEPKEIPHFLLKLEEGFDLVSGWKKTRRDPINKRWPSKLFNWATRRMAQVDLHDFNCGFKAYRREVFENIAIYGELHRYIPVLASRKGFRVGELAVVHNPRLHGRSKYGWDRYYKGLLDLITVLFITKYTRRPLHLFGAIGLTCFGSGFAINAYLAVLWALGEPLSNRPLLLLGVLLMLVGIQVLTTGLLGEMLTFKNFSRSDTYSVRERLE